MERLTSVKNPTVRALRDLKDRRVRQETGRILVEGEVMIREALGCGLEIHDLLADARCEDFAREMEAQGARAFCVPANVLESVCETRSPQGVCASFSCPEELTLEQLPNVIVALLGEGSADPLSSKVLRAAMGSGFRLPFATADDLPEALKALSQRGYRVIASDLKGCDFYARPNPGRKLVLLIGNEARGISDAVRACADMRVRLPMRGGAESLNAAIAAGIMMYDIMKEYE